MTDAITKFNGKPIDTQTRIATGKNVIAMGSTTSVVVVSLTDVDNIFAQVTAVNERLLD